MNPARWTRLRTLTERCLDLSPDAREQLLVSECADDATLAGEVRALLAEDERPDPFAEVLRPALESLARGPALTAALTGRRVGRYRVLGPLGRGGMGAVYEAEQDEPRRRVALKILDLGLASPDARSRFLYEAEILGRLAHPGIAGVFEAGTSEVDGVALPWFAMEHVPDARDLVSHAERAELDADARLALFLQVCDAVQHGHEQGVVHRDLKPSNVLVDGEGRVRVIDFGVARVSGPAGAVHTSSGQLLGTLVAMSPEQVSGDPDAVDTRSDVYSLGLLLHELLTGAPAYALDGLSLPEAARVISTRQPAALRERDAELPEDLDWILRRALEKDKRDRYASVSELAADLRRLRAHEPVLAGPPTRSYRARKFVRRHRLSVALAALVLLSLVAGLAGTLVGYFGEQHQRELAQEQEQLAEQRADEAQRARQLAEDRRLVAERAERQADARRVEAETASALAAERLVQLTAEQQRLVAARDFLESMFKGVSGRRDPEAVRVAEILEDASADLPQRFVDEPLVEAELNLALGSAFGWLGRRQTASGHLARALELQRAHLPPDDPALPVTLARLALTLEGAEQIAVETALLTLLDAHHDRLGDRAIASLERRAEMRRELGELDASLADNREALARLDERAALRSTPSASDATLRGRVLGDIARTLLDLDRQAEAEQAFLDFAAQLLAARGLQRPPPSNLAEGAAQFAEALRLALDEFELGRSVDLALDDFSNRAQDFHAVLLHRAQRGEPELWAPAEELLRAALAVDLALYGGGSRAVAVSRMSLSTVLAFRDDAEGAETEARLALETYLALDGPDARSTAMTRLALAQALNFQGLAEESEREVAETLRIYEARMGPDAWPVAEMRVNHGIALRTLERFEEAEAAMLRGYAVLEAQLGRAHGQVQWVRSEIAALYEAWGRDDERAKWMPEGGEG